MITSRHNRGYGRGSCRAEMFILFTAQQELRPPNFLPIDNFAKLVFLRSRGPLAFPTEIAAHEMLPDLFQFDNEKRIGVLEQAHQSIFVGRKLGLLEPAGDTL